MAWDNADAAEYERKIDDLRALLAEQTARAEKAEQTLAEALARIPQTWGPPEVLRHLLEKAGRCDQAETRAEHAEREVEKLAARVEGCLERGTAEEARAEKAKAERDAALAACAEMRAALIHIRERAASSIGEEESDAIDICDAIERLASSALGEGDPLTGDLPRRAALSCTDLGRCSPRKAVTDGLQPNR